MCFYFDTERRLISPAFTAQQSLYCILQHMINIAAVCRVHVYFFVGSVPGRLNSGLDLVLLYAEVISL